MQIPRSHRQDDHLSVAGRLSYAATCGHAYNILPKSYAGDKPTNLTTLMVQRILVPAVANAELSDSCPRALTIGQQGRLALYAAEHVLEDGRFCGILISLYTGMRPAECRGLRWNDFARSPTIQTGIT